MEKRRFAQLTEIKETKVVLGVLFELLTKDKQQIIRGLEAKISSQEALIESLKKQVTSHDQHFTIMPASSSVSTVSSVSATGSKATVKQRPPLHAPRNIQEKSIKHSTMSYSNKSQRHRKSDEQEEESEGDEMDESFYPSEEEESDEDYEEVSNRYKRKGNKTKLAGNAKSRSSKRSKSGENSDSFDSSSSSSSDKNSMESESNEIIPIDRDLGKYTVKVRQRSHQFFNVCYNVTKFHLFFNL